ncbi:hypothetical protein ACGO3R_00595 [Lactococcus lactis]
MLKERYGSGQARWNSKLRIVATNIEDIERQVFDENSNVDILVALQASGALQGVWPSVEINGKHFLMVVLFQWKIQMSLLMPTRCLFFQLDCLSMFHIN